MRLTPVSYATAAQFVALHHRHHQPPAGHVFSVGVADGDELAGVAMVNGDLFPGWYREWEES